PRLFAAKRPDNGIRLQILRMERTFGVTPQLRQAGPAGELPRGGPDFAAGDIPGAAERDRPAHDLVVERGSRQAFACLSRSVQIALLECIETRAKSAE